MFAENGRRKDGGAKEGCLLPQERKTAVGVNCEMFSYQTPFPAHEAQYSSSVVVCMQEIGKCFNKNIAVCEMFLSGQINFCLSPLTRW